MVKELVMQSGEIKDLLIVGSGPAGFTAAIYAARANLKILQILGSQPGGQLTVTTDVENFPGFAEVIQGPWLMEQMKSQALKVSCEMKNDHVTSVEFHHHPFKLTGSSGTDYFAKSVIISTGAQAKWLGIPGEEKYRGFGVSACATCDGFFYKNKDVAVVGGANTAVEEAIFLTNFARSVTLIHRRNTLRAEHLLQTRMLANPKISVIWDHTVEEVVGDENPKSVNGIKIRNVKTQEISDLKTDGFFIAIGHKPNTDIFRGKIDMDREGYITCPPGTTNTSVPGVFAAGDVQDKVYRQAVTAAGQGCMAALDAEKFIRQLDSKVKSN